MTEAKSRIKVSTSRCGYFVELDVSTVKNRACQAKLYCVERSAMSRKSSTTYCVV